MWLHQFLLPEFPWFWQTVTHQVKWTVSVGKVQCGQAVWLAEEVVKILHRHQRGTQKRKDRQTSEAQMKFSRRHDWLLNKNPGTACATRHCQPNRMRSRSMAGRSAEAICEQRPCFIWTKTDVSFALTLSLGWEGDKKETKEKKSLPIPLSINQTWR